MALRTRTVLAIAAFLAVDAALVAWWLCRGDAVVSDAPREVVAEMPAARPAASRVKPEEAPPAETDHAPTLSVRVLDETDKPLAGAAVVVRREDKVVATAKSDADGAVSFGAAPPRPYEVEAGIAGRGGHIRYVTDEDYGKLDLTLDMHLLPGLPAQGRVIDDTTGRAVAGARVTVDQYEPRYGMITWIDPDSYHVWAHETTDANGVFRVAAVPFGPDPKREWSRLSFWVRAPGYQQAQRTFVIAEMRLGESISLELVPSATVEGVVFLPDGKPAVGATVATAPERDDLLGWPDATTTDASGRFRLADIKVGAHCRVTVTSADGVASGEFHRVLAPASPAPDVELRLSGAASIVVHALGDAGRELKPHEEFSASVFVDGIQRDRLDGLKAGRTRLHVFIGSDAEWCGDVDVHAGTNELTVDFGAWADVRGTVKDDAGAVVPSAVIEVRVPDRDEDPPDGPRCVTTDAEGRFRVPCFAKSICRLRVRGATYIPEDHEFVAPAPDVALTARRAGGVSARLRLPPGGTWPGYVNAYNEDELDALVRRACKAALREGALEVSGIRPGHRRLHVMFDGYESQSLVVDVKAGTTTEIPDISLVTEVYESTVELRLRAVDAAGTPLAGALVAIDDSRFEWDFRTDATGARPTDLQRGAHVIRAGAPGLGGVTNCTVNDDTREIVVSLRPARRVWIHVEDRPDAAPRASRVEVRARDGLLWDEPGLDSRLRAAIDLPPGVWLLRAVDTNDKPLAETDFDVPASGEAPIDVALTVR